MTAESTPAATISTVQIKGYAKRVCNAGEPFEHDALPWSANWGIKATDKFTGERVELHGVAIDAEGAQRVAELINKRQLTGERKERIVAALRNVTRERVEMHEVFDKMTTMDEAAHWGHMLLPASTWIEVSKAL